MFVWNEFKSKGRKCFFIEFKRIREIKRFFIFYSSDVKFFVYIGRVVVVFWSVYMVFGLFVGFFSIGGVV